jgi:hypothetical protein
MWAAQWSLAYQPLLEQALQAAGFERPDQNQAGLSLHANYRAMAIANGVDPDDPALARCRDSGYETHDDPGET